MGDSVEVVTSELHLAADRLRGAGQRLQDGLSSVDLETDNLLASGWKGEAATAFEKLWDQWHNGAGQVVRALQTMSDVLDVAAENYAAADEQAGGALDSTTQGTGGGGTGGAQQPPSLAQQMNLAMQPLSQLGSIPAQVAGQLAGGEAPAGPAPVEAPREEFPNPGPESPTPGEL